MQQSSATQSLHLSFWGLRKIVACSHSSSQCLLVSTVFGTVSSLHPTSFLYLYIYDYTISSKGAIVQTKQQSVPLFNMRSPGDRVYMNFPIERNVLQIQNSIRKVTAQGMRGQCNLLQKGSRI